jgi:hypothetical protein
MAVSDWFIGRPRGKALMPENVRLMKGGLSSSFKTGERVRVYLFCLLCPA